MTTKFNQGTLQTKALWMLTIQKSTHNFWMRVSTADSTAWISAAEHVQTTGCLCTWSCSTTYCNTTNTQKSKMKSVQQMFLHRERLHTHTQKHTHDHTCPCQSVPLTRMRLSGSAESANKIWFSWSYTAFLRTYTHTQSINPPAATHLLFKWLISTYIIHFWAPDESYIIRIHVLYFGERQEGSG